MLERGIVVSYETVRRWCAKFRQTYAGALRRRQPRPGDKWHLDEVFINVPDVAEEGVLQVGEGSDLGGGHGACSFQGEGQREVGGSTAVWSSAAGVSEAITVPSGLERTPKALMSTASRAAASGTHRAAR
jgi:hypothetical protein